jgi:hypothetical protein
MRRGKYSSQNRGHFRKQAMRASIAGDLDVYTSFVELLGHSSRIFTAWRPDSIAMKIGAIIEVTSSAGAIFVTARLRSSGASFAADYRRECAGGCDCVDRNIESQPTWCWTALCAADAPKQFNLWSGLCRKMNHYREPHRGLPGFSLERTVTDAGSCKISAVCAEACSSTELRPFALRCLKTDVDLRPSSWCRASSNLT